MRNPFASKTGAQVKEKDDISTIRTVEHDSEGNPIPPETPYIDPKHERVLTAKIDAFLVALFGVSTDVYTGLLTRVDPVLDGVLGSRQYVSCFREGGVGADRVAAQRT